MFYVYFLQSLKNGKVYTGNSSKNPQQRLTEHNQGSNKWTKNNGPFKLVYYETYHCKTDAIAREKFYKTGFGKTVKASIINSIAQFRPKTDQPVAEVRAFR